MTNGVLKIHLADVHVHNSIQNEVFGKVVRFVILTQMTIGVLEIHLVYVHVNNDIQNFRGWWVGGSCHNENYDLTKTHSAVGILNVTFGLRMLNL